MRVNESSTCIRSFLHQSDDTLRIPFHGHMVTCQPTFSFAATKTITFTKGVYSSNNKNTVRDSKACNYVPLARHLQRHLFQDNRLHRPSNNGDMNTVMGKKTLESLPAEMIEEILSNLTAKELCRAQRISKFFETFIHDHCPAIVRPVKERERGRLTVLFDNVANVSDPSLFEFDEVLRRYYQYYGGPADNAETSFIFCESWLASRYPKIKGTQLPVASFGYIISALERWSKVQRITDEVDLGPYLEPSVKCVLRSLNHPPTEEAVKSLYGAVRRAKLIEPGEGMCFVKQSTTPRFVLVSRPAYLHRNFTLNQTGLFGALDGLATLLDFPDISSYYRFAYCVKTVGVLQLVRNVRARKDRRLSPMGQAAVLEELFIW